MLKGFNFFSTDQYMHACLHVNYPKFFLQPSPICNSLVTGLITTQPDLFLFFQVKQHGKLLSNEEGRFHITKVLMNAKE